LAQLHEFTTGWTHIVHQGLCEERSFRSWLENLRSRLESNPQPDGNGAAVGRKSPPQSIGILSAVGWKKARSRLEIKARDREQIRHFSDFYRY
jgi:hypothetical protein